MTNWKEQHAAALTSPQGPEIAIKSMIDGWISYRSEYAEHFDGSKIGEDYVLGPEWAKIGMALLGLLDGPTGRLDCGTVDSFIRETMKEQGFDPDEL